MAQYATGDIAPDATSQYVLPIGGDRVYTVAAYQFENLAKLVATAKAAASASATDAPAPAVPAAPTAPASAVSPGPAPKTP
jgi:hypothetical protein